MAKTTKTLNITYELKKKKGATTEHINLPISARRYAELASGVSAESPAWRSVWVALVKIAQLQGGELGAWSMGLKIKTEGQ